jgi:Flp pilus assembly protein TadB
MPSLLAFVSQKEPIHSFIAMNSERQKREKEIERIMAEAGRNRAADVAFQDEIKKTAAALMERETLSLQKSGRAKRRKRSISPITIGVWLILLGAVGLVFSMPSLGAVILISGIIAIVWATIPRSSRPSRPEHQDLRSFSKILKNSIYKLSKSFRR